MSSIRDVSFLQSDCLVTNRSESETEDEQTVHRDVKRIRLSYENITPDREMVSFFRCRNVTYLASPLVLDQKVAERLNIAWGKFILNPLNTYNDKTKEYKRVLDCVNSMKADASDKYAQSIEIKFVNDDIKYGVFASRDIKKNEIIGQYSGEVVLVSEMGAAKINNDYLFEFPETGFSEFGIDSSSSGNFTRYINDGDKDVCNVSSVEFFHDVLCRVIFIADKNINKGDQLLYDYGKSYWEDKTKLLNR